MRKPKRIPLSEMDVLKAATGAKPLVKQLAGKASAAAPIDDDAALARRHHDALVAALGPVMQIIERAKEDGFELGFAFGPNAQGKQELRPIDVRRVYHF